MQRVATGLLAALLLAGCSLPAAPETRRVPAGVEPLAVPVPDDAQQAVVVRVVDGDTVVLRGRGAGPLPGEPTRVRVLLVDTPEVGDDQECFGPEAAARTEQLLPPGATVRVQADDDPTDRFGRALLHVWTPSGANLGEVLLAEGYAVVLQLDPNRRYLEAFEASEEQARGAGRGLWAAC